MRIVIAGGTGFIGHSLASYLRTLGNDVVILSRRPQHQSEGIQTVVWDARSLGKWAECLDGADGLINLTGRSVDCVKSPDHCDEILRSRVESTRILAEAQATLGNPPPVWIQMSTAHIYGDPPVVWCTESASTGYGFAPDVGRAWEQTLFDYPIPGQRRTILRTSFVLGRDRGHGGGALPRLVWLARCGLGGRVGSGAQGFSWIHEVDLCRLFAASLGHEAWQGIVNATSPHPVSQLEFMRQIRGLTGSPFGLPASAWMVKLGARLVFGTDPDLALYGRYVVSERLDRLGFRFTFPQLRDALSDLLLD